MASMAASLMWRGVAKWGSPAPKSTSLAPVARSLAASAVTAMVAETSMRPMRSVRIFVAEAAVVMVVLFFQILAGSGGEKCEVCGLWLFDSYLEDNFPDVRHVILRLNAPGEVQNAV